jgi:crotonobetaine/carnitine-CoA ligase
LLGFLAERLPHYMVPRYIQLIDALPRTPTNKVRKAALRDGSLGNVWDRHQAGIALRDLIQQRTDRKLAESGQA